jgi:ARG/rhodanese/phosphatase superfamily protein
MRIPVSHTPSPSEQVTSFLTHLSLATRQTQKALTLWPLVRGETPPSAPEYLTLFEAFARGNLTVDELRAGATVPHVLVANRGSVAVLILFGEEIRGAKQNRVANASFLVPPLGEVVIDVSCVEQGRWSRRHGETFAGTGAVLSTEIRRKMAGRVSQSRGAGRGFQADQGELWEDVAERVRISRARAPSGAYADYIATRQHDLDELAAGFHPVQAQVGFIACIGEEVVGLEAIGRPEVFEKAFPGLVRGYLIDAIDHALLRQERPRTSSVPRFDAPEVFLTALANAPAEARPSLGMGADLRIEDSRVHACALVAGDVVHLTAFPSAN